MPPQNEVGFASPQGCCRKAMGSFDCAQDDSEAGFAFPPQNDD
jgi:hypothetical protein